MSRERIAASSVFRSRCGDEDKAASRQAMAAQLADAPDARNARAGDRQKSLDIPNGLPE
jgi:hypothetical protein